MTAPVPLIKNIENRFIRQEALPEVAVDHRLPARVAPALALPALPPAVPETVHDVRAVAVEVHPAAAFDGRQRLDGGGQLHALVGGPGLRTGDDALAPILDDDRRPAPGPGVARAGAVGVDGDVGPGQRGSSCQWRKRPQLSQVDSSVPLRSSWRAWGRMAMRQPPQIAPLTTGTTATPARARAMRS